MLTMLGNVVDPTKKARTLRFGPKTTALSIGRDGRLSPAGDNAPAGQIS